MKKIVCLIKTNLKKNFHTFLVEGSLPGPPPPPGCTLRRRSAGPRRRRASASLAARALLFELCIAAGPSVQTVRLTSKIRQKLGFKKFSIFFSPKTCSGSWAFMKYQVQPHCICSLGAYSPRTDRQTDRRTDGVTQFPGAAI